MIAGDATQCYNICVGCMEVMSIDLFIVARRASCRLRVGHGLNHLNTAKNECFILKILTIRNHVVQNKL